MKRWKDWLRQAERKIASAEWLIKGEFYEDVCFFSQQAAEFAIKALEDFKGERHRGHSVYLHISRYFTDQNLLDISRKLDQYYIPTRYPNGFDIGAPMDYFTKDQAEEAIEFGKVIITRIKKEIEELQAH